MSEGNAYVAGQHCRFNRNLPRKMGGYRNMIDGFSGPVRGDTYVYSINNFHTIYGGSASLLEAYQFDDQGFGAGVYDRTPAGFTASADNIWQMGGMQYNPDGFQALVAHAAPNMDIYSSAEFPVYFGDFAASTPLTAITSMGGQATASVSGGILALYPYLFRFGNGGLLEWSVPGDLATFPTDQFQNISAQKVIAGREDQSGGVQTPAAIFWCLDKIVRLSFAGGDTDFNFSTVPGYDGLLSTSAIVDYDGNYYWPANGRFQVYTGVIREVENNYNIRWFYDNYNKNYRQKIWGTKVPAYGEIWWFFPFGNSTECNAAIIYNIKGNYWYNTMLSRSAGTFNTMFPYPLWFDTQTENGTTYPLWQHEYLWDMYTGNDILAIESYIETSEASFVANNPMGIPTGINQDVKMDRIELDLLQDGNMTIDVITRKYPRSPDQTETYAFTPSQEWIGMTLQGRQMRFRFNSNTAGGFYEFGRSMMGVLADQGDVHP